MTTKMHATIERYFAATNKHDLAGMIADLADDAVVKDEAREHRGVPAIREWVEETVRKYKFKAAPTSVATENDSTAVSVSVSGELPGSPLDLTYRFTIQGEKIARLEIR
jgi:ketosteroid isomerase-like protein